MLDFHKRATILVGMAFSLLLTACTGANSPGSQMDQATESASVLPVQLSIQRGADGEVETFNFVVEGG